MTTARLHEPVSWRHSPLFTGRKRYGLAAKPATYTFVQVREQQLQDLVQRFELALDGRGFVPIGFRSSALTKDQFQDLFAVIEEYASRHDVDLGD